jgi:predicted amidohydrolase YtcJ
MLVNTMSFQSAAIAALLLSFPFAGAQDLSPTTIYIHGNILTGAHLRPAQTYPDPSPTPARVTALAVTNSTIVAAGSDEALLKLRGPHTQLVDLAGAFVMPGFNDAHTHIAEAGQQKLTVDLDGTTSLADMQARIAAYVATA